MGLNIGKLADIAHFGIYLKGDRCILIVWQGESKVKGNSAPRKGLGRGRGCLRG